jgi:hypothetical protein
MRRPIALVSLTLVTVVFVLGGITLWGGRTIIRANDANVMSVDAVSGGSIDSTRTVTTSDPFNVDIHIQHGGVETLDYSWFEAELCLDPSVLEFVPTADLDGDTTAESWTYTDLGGMLVHIGVYSSGDCSPLPGVSLLGASMRSAGTTSASGVAATVAFRCVGSGTATLRLLSDPDLHVGSMIGVVGGAKLPTTVADAEITCSPPPTATACPPDVCTPTATPSPAPTPTPVPTPDPSSLPNVISVDAFSGGTIDADRHLPVGTEFDIDVHIQHGGSSGTNYAGYDAGICFDSDVLDFIPTQDMTGDSVLESWTYTDLGDMFLQAATNEVLYCPVAFPDTGLFGGAVRGAGTTSASGVAATAHFVCVAQGTTTLHLVTPDDQLMHSDTYTLGGNPLPTEFADATITCLPDTDGDRCGDLREFTMGYQPIDPWDFFSVPVPARPDADPNGPKNEAVAIDDVLAVLMYAGTAAGDNGFPNPNGVAYDAIKGSCTEPFGQGGAQREGLCYDRSPSPLANPPWDAGPPDGSIDIRDVLVALAQAGLDCAESP